MGKRIKKEDRRDKRGLLILFLLFLMLFFAAVAAWALFFRPEEEIVLAPDRVPEQADQHAKPIPGDTGDQKNPSSGGSVSLRYSDQVSIDLSEERAELIFANPGRSSRDMVLQIVVQDIVLVQSGTLKPGNQVEMLPEARKVLKTGVYDGNFVIYYYNAETGMREVINTEIPIVVTVQK